MMGFSKEHQHQQSVPEFVLDFDQNNSLKPDASTTVYVHLHVLPQTDLNQLDAGQYQMCRDYVFAAYRNSCVELNDYAGLTTGIGCGQPATWSKQYGWVTDNPTTHVDSLWRNAHQHLFDSHLRLDP